ncbi:hypothetical protein N7512_003110 [Penicillium capsulatum]|nr:hypothetical protein N7512_003110 [Penicillium capsulatum]
MPGRRVDRSDELPDGRLTCVHQSFRVQRFISREDQNEFLVYTDGACLQNGKVNARAGCAFVCGSSMQNRQGFMSFRLEERGPTGEQHPQTSNRAELRAAIGGITNYMWKWTRNGWIIKGGNPVKNQDPWQSLLGLVELRYEKGMRVRFWHIPRNCNTEADRRAKTAVKYDPVSDFATFVGRKVLNPKHLCV